MANAACLTFVNSVPAPIKPSNSPCALIPKSTFSFQNPRRVHSGVQSLKAKSEDSNQSTKINSILCPECTGNGAIECTQCKGNGVNSVDHFNGQFKAGALCWLCRGKREILCGNCNGAGFMGGFLSTYDE